MVADSDLPLSPRRTCPLPAHGLALLKWAKPNLTTRKFREIVTEVRPVLNGGRAFGVDLTPKFRGNNPLGHETGLFRERGGCEGRKELVDF